MYGGPHILTLVTEVATRALKAVWHQKFNIHLRLRPEALAARIHMAENIKDDFPQIGALFSNFRKKVGDVVGVIEGDNKERTVKKQRSCLWRFRKAHPCIRPTVPGMRRWLERA